MTREEFRRKEMDASQYHEHYHEHYRKGHGCLWWFLFVNFGIPIIIVLLLVFLGLLMKLF